MEDTRARWERAYLEALDFDTWGQVEEAIEGYQRLQIAAAAEYLENVLMLPLSRRDGIGKLASALKVRAQELSSGDERSIKLNGMKDVKPYMKEIIVTDSEFPLAGLDPEAILGVDPIEDNTPEMLMDTGMGEMEYEDEVEGPGVPGDRFGQDGTLRGPPGELKRGDTVLAIFIEKWGLKLAQPFVDPRVLVSVRGPRGDSLETLQETPIAKRTTHTYCFFENTVYIQTPLNQLPDGAGIFFEFRHWKAKKHKKSVWCYCFLEMDEIKNGPITLEVYRKPANYQRNKNPELLTVKALYLHLDLVLDVA
eukprot:gene32541-17258_t